MLPSDWASADAPNELVAVGSPRDSEIRSRFELLGPSSAFDSVFKIADENGATHLFWERQYIDSDYRDEFSNFYASTFPPHPDRCERIHFLIQEAKDLPTSNLGYVTIRPISRRPVSRTVVSPPNELDEFVSCKATSTTYPVGKKFQVDGFPFLGQDTQYGVCAHAAIWMICHYHHLANRHGRRYMSDIVKSAGAVQTENRLLPSQGLTVPQIARAFQELKLPAVHYDLQSLPNDETPETIACRYLNSRLPVLLATKHPELGGHATVLVGYRSLPDGSLEFIRQNDANAPYELAKPEEDYCGEWLSMMVPMPGKIYMSGETAEAVGIANILAGIAISDDERVRELREENRLEFRSYAIEARKYKSRLLSRGVPADVVPLVMRLGTSQWIWVVEIRDKQAARAGESCVVGEILLDATSDGSEQTPLFMYVPKKTFIWPELTGDVLTYVSGHDASPGALVQSGLAIKI